MNKPYVVHGHFDEHGKQIPGTCNCDVCAPHLINTPPITSIAHERYTRAPKRADRPGQLENPDTHTLGARVLTCFPTQSTGFR